jgi:aldehyde:ferredoxin oxidoreductase
VPARLVRQIAAERSIQQDGKSYAGGSAAIAMSRTGFDAFDVTGSADRPLCLEITDQGTLFHDAHDLWGLDTFETEAVLRKRLAARSPAVFPGSPRIIGSKTKRGRRS